METTKASNGKTHEPTIGPAKRKKPYKPPSFTIKHLDPVQAAKVRRELIAETSEGQGRMEKEDLSTVLFMAQKLAKRKGAGSDH